MLLLTTAMGLGAPDRKEPPHPGAGWAEHASALGSIAAAWKRGDYGPEIWRRSGDIPAQWETALEGLQ